MSLCDPRRSKEPDYVQISGTLSGNPVAATAGLATLDVLTRPGTYGVRLTVTDNGGGTGTITQNVTVTAPPPGYPWYHSMSQFPRRAMPDALSQPHLDLLPHVAGLEGHDPPPGAGDPHILTGGLGDAEGVGQGERTSRGSGLLRGDWGARDGAERSRGREPRYAVKHPRVLFERAANGILRPANGERQRARCEP